MDFPAYTKEASRIEFCIVRNFYLCPVAIVGGIVSAFMMIGLAFLWIGNNLSVLFLGKRSESFYNLYTRLTRWRLAVSFYAGGLTDDRPPLTP